MKKRLTSFLLVLALSFSLSLPAFAVDDMDYYSLSPVGGSEPSSVSLYPVSPSATGDGWTSSDSNRLRDIWQGLTDSSSGNPGSIAYCVWWIWNYLKDDIRSSLSSIQQNTLATASRILDSNSLLGSINTSISGIDGFATENTLHTICKFFTADVADGSLRVPFYTDGSSTPTFKAFFKPTFGYLSTDILYDTTTFWNGGDYSLFHYIKYSNKYLKLLQETLASEDDRQLAENYKENRQQAEQDFLSGQSGKTSLGKGDFSNASQVGGALNDTFNMGGAAKVSDFLSGFGSAGAESQSWFSQTTANNLNAVEAGDGTQGVSTFADDGETMVDVDPDPYNMVDIYERYDWLEGVNMDD